MYYTYKYIVYTSIHDIHKYTWYTEDCIIYTSQQRRYALASHTITKTGWTQSSTVQLGLKTNENAHLFKECTFAYMQLY